SKRSLLEKIPFLWKRLKYTQKLIVRNILQGRIKILLSSVGVIGAITLLITGISLQNSADVMINNTVDSYNFDATIHMRQDYDPYAIIDLPIDVETIEARKNVYATYLTDAISIYALIPNQTLMHLQSINEHKIVMTANSVIIPRNMAILYDLKIGDTMQVEIDKALYDLKVTDIDKQNLGKNVYVSFDMFEAMGLSIETRDFMISTLDDVDTETLLNDPGILSVDTKQKMVDRAKEMMSMLSRIIMIIVLSATALTVTVIYNLASINIIERERELATLRVLGYSVKEVKKLINLENYLLVLLGSIGGIPMGLILFKTISDLVSTNEFMMISDTDITVIIISVASAFAFTALTNFILEFKIRKIALVEALKAVE
ncbi:MAG: FtsX-like permease family protein, partial [Erysipelotrichaceae bacterium]